MPGLPVSAVLAFLLVGIIFLGFAEQTLARMRLSDAQALGILVAIMVGSFLPAVPVTATFMLDIGGALIPIGIALYLVVTTDTNKERLRAIIAAILTGAILFGLDRVLTPEPGTRPMLINIDPVWLPGVVAAILGYAFGRSRRAAFVAGTLGVVFSDIATAVLNASLGRSDTVIIAGGAGVVDSVLVAGVIAVTLAELFGEAYESLVKSRAREPGSARPLSRRFAKRNKALFGIGVLLALAGTFVAADFVGNIAIGAPSEDTVSTIMDSSGACITQIGRRVFRGDRYLTEDNILYRIYRVKGPHAWAMCIGEQNIDSDTRVDPRGLTAVLSLAQPEPGAASPPSSAPGPIAVYFTHNDESYVPTSGTSSADRGQGGVHRVGDAFAEQLGTFGIAVNKSDRMHYPHDAGAYRRSRTTAQELVAGRPSAIFDIHRDAAPIEPYTARDGAEPIARIRFVVGQQNPTRAINENFATTMKSVADKMFPGLMGGIYFGHGNYNQDLYPTMALVEIGAHTNSEPAAQRAARLFAEVVASYFGIR